MMCKGPETGWGLACWRPSKIIWDLGAVERNWILSYVTVEEF